jgi:predicted extracellular nuclease
MKRTLLLIMLTTAALVAIPSPANAASPVLIGRTQYDSPGSDTRTNTSLNAEYVTLKNMSTSSRSLTGWTLRDAQGHVYKFGTFTLGAGRSVVIHTGKGANTSTNRYWGSGNYIWNNTGDTAYLRSPAGTLLDTCRWTTTRPGYTYC